MKSSIGCILYQILLEQRKKDEMGRDVAWMRYRWEMDTKIWLGKLKIRDHLENEIIILKLTLKR
jgi:hypothetical protein